MTPRAYRRLLLALALACASVPGPASSSGAARPRSVILMIPDGCGWASMTLARIVAQHPLALDGILVGACETDAADQRITDSAAAATAYACGIKTVNRALGLDPERRPVATVLEGAEARGMSTGLVATSRITHATPAAFAAHVPERDEEQEIAAEELAHGVDVLLGGGRREFLPAAQGGLRTDGRDLIAEARAHGYRVITSRKELLAPLRLPVLGLFANDHMRFELDRDTLAEPSLAEMTRATLPLLAANPRGFFVMIEGSRVDHAAHRNDPAAHVSDLLAYDEAVRAALDFARKDGHTLVISVADHETGGLSVGSWSDQDSASALRPETLRNVRASVERMAEKIRRGEAAADVLARDAGITDLTPAERVALQAAGVRETALERALGTLESGRARVGWTTWSHTADDVGLYAFGPGSERLRGVHQNNDVGRAIAELLGLDLSGLTARLRRDQAAPAAR